MVRICRHFSEGFCEFSDEICWYKHTAPENFPQTKKFKCSLCDKVFEIKSDFMKHRKMDHNEYVSVCKLNSNGSCHFGKEKCWYKHEDEVVNQFENWNDDNQEMMTRIFDMMEKFAERFDLIENQL